MMPGILMGLPRAPAGGIRLTRVLTAGLGRHRPLSGPGDAHEGNAVRFHSPGDSDPRALTVPRARGTLIQ